MIITTGHVKAIARQFSNETDVSYSRALEMTSKALGYKNWNGLKASFETAIAIPEVITPQISDGQKMRRKTVFSIHKGQDVQQTLMGILYHKDLIPFIQDMSKLGAINLNNQYKAKDIILFLLTLKRGKYESVEWCSGNAIWPLLGNFVQKIFPHKIPKIAQDLIDFETCSFINDDIIFFDPTKVNETALRFSAFGISSNETTFMSHWPVVMNEYFAFHCLSHPENEFEKALSTAYNDVQSNRKTHAGNIMDFWLKHIKKDTEVDVQSELKPSLEKIRDFYKDQRKGKEQTETKWYWEIIANFGFRFNRAMPIPKINAVSTALTKAVLKHLIVETIRLNGFVYVEKGAMVCVRTRLHFGFYVFTIKIDEGSILKNATYLADFLQSDRESSHSIEFSFQKISVT